MMFSNKSSKKKSQRAITDPPSLIVKYGIQAIEVYKKKCLEPKNKCVLPDGKALYMQNLKIGDSSKLVTSFPQMNCLSHRHWQSTIAYFVC